jgi:hypothetical protein
MASRIAIACLPLLALAPAPAQPPDDPALPAILRHWFSPKPAEIRTLSQGGVIARDLPASGSHISVLAACAVTISPDTFAARIASLGGASNAPSVSGRFSAPPSLTDLEQVTLDQGDIDRLRICRVGDCRLNLGEEEIASVRRSLAVTASGPSPETQQIFRRILLERAQGYLAAGLAGLADYSDRENPVAPAAVFERIVSQSPLLTSRLREVASDLTKHPPGPTAAAESFLGWSRVIINGKTVIMITDYRVIRPAPAADIPQVVVAAKQVYASRYMNGSLGLTMLFAGSGGRQYLVHVDRSDLDELGGAFTGLKRSLMEGRIKDEAMTALTRLRNRLAAQSPPSRAAVRDDRRPWQG